MIDTSRTHIVASLLNWHDQRLLTGPKADIDAPVDYSIEHGIFAQYKTRVQLIGLERFERTAQQSRFTLIVMSEESAVLIFEITTPGTWLDYEDREWSWKIESLLQHLESQFFEANAALNLFTETQAKRPTVLEGEHWERDAHRRSEIRLQVEQEIGGAFSRDLWEEVSFETEVRFKREQWSHGRMPREFGQRQPFTYARAFLYALDAFKKFLGVLFRETGVPPGLSTIHASVADAFPHLRGVRNTAQHLEDRARGLGAGRDPRPLDLQPIENQMINAPGGAVLVLNSLNGTRYGSTMVNGHYGEVDVSPESMQQLQRILHAVLLSFRWRGPKRHAPGV